MAAFTIVDRTTSLSPIVFARLHCRRVGRTAVYGMEFHAPQAVDTESLCIDDKAVLIRLT